MNKRTIVSLLVFIGCMLIWWYSGADIFQRNQDNAFAIVISLFFGGAAYTCPIWYNRK